MSSVAGEASYQAKGKRSLKHVDGRGLFPTPLKCRCPVAGHTRFCSGRLRAEKNLRRGQGLGRTSAGSSEA